MIFVFGEGNAATRLIAIGYSGYSHRWNAQSNFTIAKYVVFYGFVIYNDALD